MERSDLEREINQNNQCKQYPTAVVMCIVLKESSGDPSAQAKRPNTARGLMQVTQDTAKQNNCEYAKLLDAGESIRCGTRILCHFAQHAPFFGSIGRYHTGAGKKYAKLRGPYQNDVNNCTLCILNGGSCAQCDPNPH
jgi:soluble lytic murein transglycosylase-like protein